MTCAGLLFFTTYTLLVLFWAEIYHQARSMPTGSLRPMFVGLNAFVYLVLGCLWLWSSMATDDSMQVRHDRSQVHGCSI